MAELSRPACLSEKMSWYLDAEKLAENAAAYPEMQWELSATERAQASNVEEHLLRLPLIHVGRAASMDSIQARGLAPAICIPQSDTNTHDFDRSLGLDRYAFMGWGSSYMRAFYGSAHVSVDASLLLDDATLAGPTDVLDGHSFSIDRNRDRYHRLSPEKQQEIKNNYFDKLTTGRDWVTIIDRRVLRNLIDHDCAPIALEHGGMFGEVKYNGIVDPKYISRVTRLEDVAPEMERIAELGFMPQSYIYGAQSHPVLSQADQKKFADAYAIHIEQGAEVWKAILTK